MAQPDVRVDPAEVDAAGTATGRVGGDVAAAVRTSGPVIAPQPAWDPGFDSVAASATLADADLDLVRRLAADLGACAAALHACAAAWAASDDAVAGSLRTASRTD